MPKSALLLWGLMLLSYTAYNQIFVNSLDKIPSGWSGPVFQLSKDYPKTLPDDAKPWKQIDFRTDPKKYMQTVLNYFLEGNTVVNWVVQDNSIRKWYHAPSMGWQPARRPYGREFIHGLTRERNSAPEELWPSQTRVIQNWAVGFYNPIGAYTFGQVWSDTLSPNIDAGRFAEGTVSGKLLFTAATDTDVPYLRGGYAWDANIHQAVTGTAVRTPQKMRLLQIDIAVKDDRAGKTCWVFGTFAYNNNAPGQDVWQKMVPVGLMWGNDPQSLDGKNLKETWINPDFVRLFRFPDGRDMHIGYNGRLNGPVDNKISSCLSCHSTAQYPQFNQLVPDINSPSSLQKYFRNLDCSEAFDKPQESKSLDYSLQLSGGIAAALANRQQSHLESLNKEAGPSKDETDFVFTSMDDDLNTQAGPGGDSKKNSSNWLLWVIGGIFVFILLAKLGSRIK